MIKIGVLKEKMTGERRVALTPDAVGSLKKSCEIFVEEGAGVSAGFIDDEYIKYGAKILKTREEVYGEADVIFAVRLAGADSKTYEEDKRFLRKGLVLIASMEPLWSPKEVKEIVEAGCIPLAMELIPRITKAQSMDILSSQATIAGYKAVLLAAEALPKMFPMLMTAAGTIKAAKVLIIGAGVAGLQAISTARRLGAIVSGYDIRPAVKEQIESLGAKFVELPLDTKGAEASGGYARELTKEELEKQRALLADTIAGSDVVITTAAVPGKKSPVIVTADMVKRMAPFSVVIDIAAEKGGNCELTKPGENYFTENKVNIIGPINLPSTVPYHASQMFSKNLTTFFQYITKKDGLNFDTSDEIVSGTMIGKNGEITNAAVKKALGIS